MRASEEMICSDGTGTSPNLPRKASSLVVGRHDVIDVAAIMGACKSVALFGHISNLHTEKRQSCNEISSFQTRESSDLAAEMHEGP